MRLRSPHDREILRLALPALGALAAEPLYVLVDTAIVGHLGRTPLAGLAIAGTLLSEVVGLCTFLEYGTTANRLDREGAAVEMGDAVLGLACSELAEPPHWAVVRNMSDPVINGDLPAREFHLNPQTTWAVGYYTAYGKWTSIIGALATWGIIAGL